MSSMGVEHDALVAGARDWRTLSRLMTTSARALADQGTAGIPSSAQGAARAFLSSWSGSASESAEIATGFAGALDATRDNYASADDATDRRFADLDGRLGPQR